MANDPDALARSTGLVCAFLGIGSAIGPIVAGALYDVYGTYVPGFLFGASALTLAAALVLAEPRRPREFDAVAVPAPGDVN